MKGEWDDHTEACKGGKQGQAQLAQRGKIATDATIHADLPITAKGS